MVVFKREPLQLAIVFLKFALVMLTSANKLDAMCAGTSAPSADIPRGVGKLKALSFFELSKCDRSFGQLFDLGKYFQNCLHYRVWPLGLSKVRSARHHLLLAPGRQRCDLPMDLFVFVLGGLV